MNNPSPRTLVSIPFSIHQKALLATIAVVYLWVFWTSLSEMTFIWWNRDTFAHAPLIPIISGWLIWRKRSELLHTPLDSSRLGLVAITLCSSVWLIGVAINIAVLQQLAAVCILLLMVPLVFGFQITFVLLFPLAYLLFMVPIGEELVPTLQKITADITVLALRASGIPVYINGLYIEIPSGKFEVAKACSGVRYLIAGMAVGALYAYLNYRRFRTQLIFMMIAVLVPIIANGVRAYLIVLIAHLSDMKYATGADHLLYGWVFFGIVMGLMFWIGSFWNDPDQDPSGPSLTQTDHTLIQKLPLSRTKLILITIVLFTGINYTHSRLAETSQFDRLAPYSIQLEEVAAISHDSDWNPVYIGADRTGLQWFSVKSATPSSTVGLFIADYQSESQGKELISQSNRVNVYENWTKKSETKKSILLENTSLPIIETEWRHINGTKRRTWHVYQVYQRLSDSPLKVKFMQALNKFSDAPHLSSVFAFSIDYVDDAHATLLLKDFVSTHWLTIEKQHQQSIKPAIYSE